MKRLNLMLLVLAFAAAGAADKPNIIFILADDLASYELGCYGGRNVRTPNIDRLASEGMRFTAAFASEAMCVPIRSSLYTGLFPARHGACRNQTAVKPDTRSVPHCLEPLGYRVGLTGKVHVKPKKAFPFVDVPGFEPNCVAETANYDVAGIRDFMARDPKQPFCLFVCSTLPHVPWTVGDASHFPPDKLLLSPIMIDTPDMRTAFSKYCAEVKALDQQVGDVLKIVKDDTLVFFGGEQGPQFPGAKWTLFAPGVASAMIARWPGRIKAGTVSDAIVEYEDVLPTMIEAAGGEPSSSLDGRSFLGVLTGKKTEHRDFAFGIHNNIPEGRPYPIRSIRSRQHKLILNLTPENQYHEKHMMDIDRENYWKSLVEAAKHDAKAAGLLNRFLKRPAVELYDVANDPWEMNNLADKPELAGVRRDLEDRLRRWMKEQGDPGAALDKLNILHIHADDHRPDGLRALGNKLLKTPNLDTLVERGFVFTRCYTQGAMVGAVCQPSRTMMLTGRSLFRIPGRVEKGDPEKALPRVIKAAGYETWHCGKGGNEYTTGLNAFDTNLVMNDHLPEMRRGSSERHADAAIKFLTGRDKSKPFYIYLAPPVPHDPRVAAPEFHKFYDPAKVPLSPAFMPVHPFDNGEMTVRDEKLAPWPRTPEDTRQQLADYYACVTGLDHHVGRIFEALKKTGQWDNTIIIFSGDNGLSLGEHGLFGKQNLYEFGGMHAPLVIAGPGIPKGRSDALVYLMDLYPTFCDFAGATPPQPIEGRNLAPVISGKTAKVRDALYTAYRDVQRAVRDDRWKLIRYPQVNVTQLFDLQTDPHELTNLADKKEYAGKLKEMLALLKKEMATYDDSFPLDVANPKPPTWTPPSAKEIKHHWVCVDNGNNLLLRVNQIQPDKSWSKPIPPGSRDLQLVGEGNRILVSHGNGAAEYSLGNGAPTSWAVTRYSDIQSAVRLLNGHTLLARVDGTVFEVDADGKEIASAHPQEKLNVRLMRVLDNGNLLLAGATPKAILALARDGRIVRKIPLPGKSYTAVRVANGHYRSGIGEECKIVEVDSEGKLCWFVGGKAEHPGIGLDFFSGWDTLPNGNIVVANWLGHGKQGKGCHLAEFTRDNKLVWTWQDHALAKQVTNVKMIE